MNYATCKAELMQAEARIQEHGDGKDELVAAAYAQVGKFALALLRYEQAGEPGFDEFFKPEYAMKQAVGAIYQ